MKKITKEDKTAMKSMEEIAEVLEDGIARLVNGNGDFPAGNYEDGVIMALSWVLGAPVAPPFDENIIEEAFSYGDSGDIEDFFHDDDEDEEVRDEDNKYLH